MIKSREYLSMAEATEYIDKDSAADTLAFIKKFSELNPKEAKEMRKKLQELEIIKMNDFHISKIIDILPLDEEDLNKIFVDANLDEDETKKILEVVKEFK